MTQRVFAAHQLAPGVVEVILTAQNPGIPGRTGRLLGDLDSGHTTTSPTITGLPGPSQSRRGEGG